jgi:hypothetical protein
MKIPEKFILLKDLYCEEHQLREGFLDIETHKGSVFKFYPYTDAYLLYDDVTKTLIEVQDKTSLYRMGIRVSDRVDVFRFLVKEKYIFILSWIDIDSL